jgi:hypothetical protein
MKFVESVKKAVETYESQKYVFPQISLQNGKLKEDNIASFSLPAIISCPGAGKCSQFCYGITGTYSFPCTINVLAKNYVASKRDTFVMAMIQRIEALPKKIGVIRVHDTGDFYSSDYVKKWDEIATEVNAIREVRFYAYTKAFSVESINMTPVLNNPYFNLVQSEGSINDSKIDYNRAHSRIFNSSDDLAMTSYVDTSESDQNAANGIKKIGLVIHGGFANRFKNGS